MTNAVPTIIRSKTSKKGVNAELAKALRNSFARPGFAKATVAKPINQIPARTTITAASLFKNSIVGLLKTK